MSDHNFEKQIRQKLDELRVPPADRVWFAVELQIRKDKRRRRGLVLYPLLLLLIGGGSYFIFEGNFSSGKSRSEYAINSTLDNNSTAGSTDKSPNTGTVPGVNNDTNSGNTSSSNSPQGSQDVSEAGPGNKKGAKEEIERSSTSGNLQKTSSVSDDGTGDKEESESSRSGPIPVLKNNNVIGTGSDAAKKVIVPDVTPLKKKSDRNSRIRNSRIARNNPVAQPKRADTRKIEAPSITQKGNDESTPPAQVQADEQLASKTHEPPAFPDSLSNALADAGEKLADSTGSNRLPVMNTPVDSISLEGVEKTNTVAKKARQSSFQWGITGSAGVSSLADGGIFDGIMNGEKALVADVSPNAMNNAPSPTAVIYKPSSIEKGFSFSIGAFIQKSLSKRFSLSTGVQYRYYSTNIQVGHRVDSATILQNAFGSLNVSQYYRSAPVPVTYEYTNRFQFVELPVTANFRVHKRLPVYWNGGVLLSYLVSTNALHFDSQTGVYYKDNGLFNKLQANLSTSVTVSLFNSSKMPVHVGPQLQYGLTNLMKRDVSAAKHLFFFGVGAKVYLKK